jgi:hypothetical protein
MAYDLAEVAFGFKNTAAVHLRIIKPPCQCFGRCATSRSADFPRARNKFACDQRIELIEPDKWLLDAEPLAYESSHARPSAIALDCYNRGRTHTKRKRSIAPFQNDSLC